MTETTDGPNRKAIEDAQAVLYAEGTKLRTQVLGKSHVAESRACPEFLQPIQNMAVTGGWSLCWTRPGLELKTRSLLCIVMLSLLGRDQELAVHVRGAIQNGCTKTEIREALVQVSIYAGVPCALHASQVAWATLQEIRSKSEANGV